jgi:hypothetical protein
MDECLAYFRQAIEHPGSVPPWAVWWAAHEELVRRTFDRTDYLRLKYRKLAGAEIILARTGWTPPPEEQRDPLRTAFCPVCGERLFWMGENTSREEVRAFAERAGIEHCHLHPGAYCPNRCFWVLIEYVRDPSFWQRFQNM